MSYNEFREYWEVELTDVPEHPDGIRAYAYETYHGYSDESTFGIAVMDMNTLDDIEDVRTTWDTMEQDFNRVIAKYRAKNAKITWIR